MCRYGTWDRQQPQQQQQQTAILLSPYLVFRGLRSTYSFVWGKKKLTNLKGPLLSSTTYRCWENLLMSWWIDSHFTLKFKNLMHSVGRVLKKPTKYRKIKSCCCWLAAWSSALLRAARLVIGNQHPKKACCCRSAVRVTSSSTLQVRKERERGTHTWKVPWALHSRGPVRSLNATASSFPFSLFFFFFFYLFLVLFSFLASHVYSASFRTRSSFVIVSNAWPKEIPPEKYVYITRVIWPKIWK